MKVSEFGGRVALRHTVDGNEHAPQLDEVDDAGNPIRIARDVLLTSRHGRVVREGSIHEQIGIDRFQAVSYQPSVSMSTSAKSRWLGRFISSLRSRATCIGVLGNGFTKM